MQISQYPVCVVRGGTRGVCGGTRHGVPGEKVDGGGESVKHAKRGSHTPTRSTDGCARV